MEAFLVAEAVMEGYFAERQAEEERQRARVEARRKAEDMLRGVE